MATKDEIIELVQIQLSSSSTLISDDGYESAVNTASTELGWSYPQTDPTRVLWLVKRTIRHCCYMLWLSSAQKFKYKQVNLQQRFEHYQILVRQMDREFTDALTEQPSLFAGVDIHKMFGTSLGAGFVYSDLGEDMTYDESA
jgi:hypothetical protein